MSQSGRWGLTQQRIKDQNIKMLFGCIRREAPVSRAGLAKITGLSATTVSQLVEELIARRWVRETGAGDSAFRGRKPIMLEVDPAGGVMAVLEVRSRTLLCSLYDLALGTVDAREIQRDGVSGLKRLLRQRRLSLSRLLGVHVVFPGLFQPETGLLRSSTVIPQEMLPGPRLVETLREAFPASRVKISNDTAAIAYSEFLSGSYVPGVRLLSVCVDEGISASVITGDVRRDPARCFSLELGHLIIDRQGPRCLCGNRGCLEALCSVPALLGQLEEATGVSLPHSGEYGSEVNRASLKLAAGLLEQGGEAAAQALERYCRSLCCGLAGVINLLDIRRLHIGGGVSLLGDRFTGHIRRMLGEEFALTTSHPVTVAAFGGNEESIRRAAAAMILDDLLQG